MIAAIDGMCWLLPEGPEDEDELRRIRTKYTYPNPEYTSAKEMGASTRNIDPWFYLWRDGDEGVDIGIPRSAGIEYCVRNGIEWTDLRVPGRCTGLSGVEPQYRKGQLDAVLAVLGALESPTGGCTLQAPCGAGKTVLGTDIIRRVGVSTAVLVHKNFLANQWEEEIGRFIPGAKVGRVQGDQIDSGSTYDVVICMVQSLTSRDYSPTGVFDTFGLVVGDECHRYGAQMWSAATSLFPARYRLGLTATPERRDGMSVVFLSNFGGICHRMVAERMVPRLEVVELDTYVPPEAYMMHRGGQRKPNMPRLISALAGTKSRTQRILRDVLGARNAGRRGIVLTHRVDHVTEIALALLRVGVDARQLVGGMSEAKQMAAADGEVVVGTFQMASEGLDVPEFDTLFLATPQASIEQAVGRILRVEEGKKQPLVIDYVDRQIGICMGLFRARCKTYNRLGFQRRR